MLLKSSDLQAFLTAQGIAGEILHVSVPTPTVETAAGALGVQPEQIVKSILFLVEGAAAADSTAPLPVLAIACGTGYVERRAIGAHYGVGRKRVKLASPEEVAAISGFEVGAMPPFGHRQPLPTLLDRRVLDLPAVYAGGGDENAMLRLDPRDIARYTGAAVLDLTAIPEGEGG
jgi:prolyl-tRNA editing enzyme YbaK/EbsC (Cys-tRNA(Pro) deacylase)